VQTKDIKVGEDYAAYPYYRRRRHYMDDFRIRVKVLATGECAPGPENRLDEPSWERSTREARTVKVRVVQNPKKRHIGQPLGAVRSVTYIEPRMIEMPWALWLQEQERQQEAEREQRREVRRRDERERDLRKRLSESMPMPFRTAPMVQHMIASAGEEYHDNFDLSLPVLDRAVKVATGELPSEFLVSDQQGRALVDATFTRLDEKNRSFWQLSHYDEERDKPMVTAGLVKRRRKDDVLIATARGEKVARALYGNEYDFDDNDEEDTDGKDADTN
jgi:hypothetical protein